MNLLDVNVLIALAWDGHEYHLPAHAWFGKNSPSGFATCNTTQSAFLRLSLNPDVVGSKLNIAERLAQLESFTKHPSHQFWEDGTLDTTASAWRTVTGHKTGDGHQSRFVRATSWRQTGHLRWRDAKAIANWPATFGGSHPVNQPA